MYLRRNAISFSTTPKSHASKCKFHSKIQIPETLMLVTEPCQVMRERTNYLIMVLCEDVSIEDVDEDMRLYLKTNTYLPRDSRWFWDKLRYAMPQTPLSVLLERRGCERRESECPLIDAVAQDLYVAEGAAAAPCCSYRGPVTDGSREPRAPTCCQHSGPTCGSSATKT